MPRLSQAKTFAAETLAYLSTFPAVRVLLFATIVWLTLFGLLKERLWRDPRSGFFDPAKAYDLHYSAIRQEQARAWIAEQDQIRVPDHGRSKLYLSSSSIPEPAAICVGLVTCNRPGRQYLNETIGSMLEGLTADERKALNVRLLFAHSDPSVHPDWDQNWLRGIDAWSGYENLTLSETRRLRRAERERNFYVKGVIDYTYMLEECLTRTSAPYIALVEDDIIFAEGWLSRTAAAVSELTRRIPSPNWLYLRLFYTETSLGWETDTDYWYRNMHLAFALAMTITLAITLTVRTTSTRLRPRLDLATILILTLIVAPAFTQLIFMVGKYNLSPLRGVVRMDKHGCCTQGLVFPRAQAQNLLHALGGREGQTDSMIETFADENGLERYALAPQVLQHVGLVSSRDNLAINTRSTWAFWFETQRAEVLSKEHEALAKEIDWQTLKEGR